MDETVKGPKLVALDPKKVQVAKVINLMNLLSVRQTKYNFVTVRTDILSFVGMTLNICLHFFPRIHVSIHGQLGFYESDLWK